MFDVHTHILPNMDDGSSSPEKSIAMLQKAYRQGVRYIAATSHYYPDEEYPEQYLQRRNDAAERLAEAIREEPELELPEILLGAEVAFYDGISRSERIKALCYENTDLLLLELPCRTWTESVLHEVVQLPYTLGIRPVIAHIDRYMMYQKRGTIPMLLDEGVLIQANASFFLNRSTQRKALKMFDRQQIHLLGSDCHNMSDRAPELGEAAKVITEKFGAGAMRSVNSFARTLFGIKEGAI